MSGGRPRAVDEWDGVVRHKKWPGYNGFKNHGCRCDQGCMAAGEEIRRRQRESDKEKRQKALAEQNFKHGLTGYRAYGCRCEVCALAGKRFNDENRAAGRTRGKYRKSRAKNAKPDDIVEVTEPEINWDELAHLRPGHNVRRRKAA